MQFLSDGSMEIGDLLGDQPQDSKSKSNDKSTSFSKLMSEASMSLSKILPSSKAKKAATTQPPKKKKQPSKAPRTKTRSAPAPPPSSPQAAEKSPPVKKDLPKRRRKKKTPEKQPPPSPQSPTQTASPYVRKDLPKRHQKGKEPRNEPATETPDPTSEDYFSFDWKKPIDSPNFWRYIGIGLIFFFLFDIILLIVWAIRKSHDSSSNNSSVLATVPQPICLEYLPGEGRSLLCDVSQTRQGGGVPNLLAQAILAGGEGIAQISLIPGGLVGSDIPAGSFTKASARDVFSQEQRSSLRSLQPDTELVVVDATGSQIQQVLEQSIHDAFQDSAQYPYSAHLRFSVDGRVPLGQRVISPVVKIQGVWGALGGDDQVYSVLTTQALSQDSFALDGEAVDFTPLEALIDYAKAVEVLETPEWSTREYVKPIVIQIEEGLDDPDAPSPETSLVMVPETICLEWIPGEGKSAFCSVESTLEQGGGVCNVVGWNIREAFPEVDIVLLHAGVCQSDILQGDFEVREAESLIPNNVELVLLTLSGLGIINVLEDAVDAALTGNSGSYPYPAGMRFDVSTSERKGARVTSLEFKSGDRWKSWSSVRTYSIVTTTELADGKMGYDGLLNAILREGTEQSIRDVFVEQIQEMENLIDVPLEDYSTKTYEP